MKIGFIGGGNMASAMIKSLYKEYEILAYARSKNDELKDKFGIKIFENEKEVALHSDILVLAVKPKDYENVLLKIRNCIKDRTIISLAPNFRFCDLNGMLGFEANFVRTMPNTPVTVKKGVSAVCFGENLNQSQKDAVMKIYSKFGIVYEIDEKLFPAFTGISGSLPAYVFVFIESLADAGVLNGIPRNLAYDIVINSIIGSAELALQSKKHPAVLKDEVCSPNGTTIEALRVLEDRKFRSSVIEAVSACAKKATMK